ncbi:unnamed protein product [Plutella xylostella]|uniref:ATP-dependent DNA helicase n=1 Tax=Plutella xylostella TaxID=51655 RepID=A0A8S4DBU2_PLUXY|nr:unnamed protein product [Plutella xylostella]
MRERQSNETADERNHHLSLIRERLSNETAEERDHRLSLIRERLSNESSEQREHRLSLIRERLSNETAEERDHRLSLIRERLSNESSEQREHRLSLIRERLSNESSEQRDHRLSLIRERLSNESSEQREHRLSLIRERLANETAEERDHRLSLIRERLSNESNGKNGFGEERDIPITALDYFQARLMGSDKRFHRNDYLFFALSVVEYFRAKSSVSVSCRMRQGNGERTPQGLVENMHLTMRNIRGSASYWRRCCSELIARVRSLGAPTWFMTLSCNDLNWPDMIKALIIADGGDLSNTEALSFSERLALVQQYPVVVARQFSVRVNVLLRYLRNNNTCLGGPIQDYWYRIEFQNRGSPHLHMLIWCDGIPDFSTAAGIEVIENVVSCSLNPDDPLLCSLVESVQIHKHTATCHKERNDNCCRFGFPKAPAATTTCLGPDEALNNNGRFCILKRTPNETMVNNYSPEILHLWEGNMDIQPCGNVTSVAYYVAKYASKCEPHDTGEVVRDAITKAKRSGGDVWKQLFAVSMAILSQRLVSAPECAYRLCHLPLKMSTRKAVFVNSCKPEERFRLLRFEGDETSIYNNIFDRYVLRPDELENISLAEFAVRYETVSSSTWANDEDGDIEMRHVENQRLRYITLRDNSRMRIRNKPAVLRTRYYTLNSDKEAYFYNLLVCHIPFRDEMELLLEGESAEECFLRRQGELRPLLNDLSSEEFAHAEQVIQQALAQAAALNAGQVMQADDTRNEPLMCADEHILINGHDDYCDDIDERGAMTDDIFFVNIRGLNVEQNHLFQKITQAIQNDLNGNEDRLLLFITGGAGSGKSFLLKLLVEHIKRCYAPTVDSLLNPIFVEVALLTGVAARQIFGKTLHAVFYLPIEKGNARAYTRMTGHKLEQERRKWRHINWLIIDEISMVSYENLRMIHLRLQEFKNNDLLFGGLNILLFGDIMQLPPVKGNWCFIQPAWCSAEVNLWHQFSFCELTINMRQRNDQDFIDLLNHLRFGELTTAELEILCERRRIPLTEDFADGAVVRIYPTVKQVDEYNNKMSAVNAVSNRMYRIQAIDESREASTYGRKPPDNALQHEALLRRDKRSPSRSHLRLRDVSGRDAKLLSRLKCAPYVLALQN